MDNINFNNNNNNKLHYKFSNNKLATSTIIIITIISITFITLAFFIFSTVTFCRDDIIDRDRRLITSIINRAQFSAVLQLHTVSSVVSRNITSKFPTSFPEKGKKMKQKKKRGIIEEGMARARASIREAVARNRSFSSIIDSTSFVYRNPSSFYQSYLEMERRLKVYVYEEGELPIVHDGPCKDIYTVEGRFIDEIERGAGQFRTRDPTHAHVYFMPFSVTRMVKYLYTPMTYNVTPLRQFVSDYVDVISTKHPFWNTTLGSDHFMLACHDWGTYASEGNANLYNNAIRVLCNANSSEGFSPRKDVSLPEIHLYDGTISPKLQSIPPPTTPRPNLAFFAGGLHGPIRPILLEHWKGRDQDFQVYEYLPKGLDYYTLMIQSKFCLCPSGHEVASPRVVEAIYAECVPVILSKSYVLPFSDVLRWEAFSIQVDVSEIPRLKEILMAVSDEQYASLINGIKAVRKHFTLNKPAKRFDVFHMILHSVWLRRLNMKLQ